MTEWIEKLKRRLLHETGVYISKNPGVSLQVIAIDT